eukprot:TRINITY_DN8722_c0_g1_i2.p2 TRINITY_DN8722_c0_g1~~TRINITY_DN8722_c0_g1_i2.p2  ORF type:complete len:342 (+),score=13.10 TRINITY_DN8722_c0_g1_i2:59-1027(+)
MNQANTSQQDQSTENTTEVVGWGSRIWGFVLWSFPIFTLSGIPVRVHFSFPVYVLFVVINSFRSGNVDNFPGFVFLVYALILPITVLSHELGRAFAARCVGHESVGIILWPLGGLGVIQLRETTSLKNLWVAFAGSLTHPPMMVIWFLLGLAVNGGFLNVLEYWTKLGDYLENKFFVAVCLGAFWFNVIVMAFNLLFPIYPLDGGVVFANLLLLCRVPVNLTAKIIVVLGIIGGVLVIIFGIYFFAIITILVGVFMIFLTYFLFRHVRNDTVTQHPLFMHMAEQGQEGQEDQGGIEEIDNNNINNNYKDQKQVNYSGSAYQI